MTNDMIPHTDFTNDAAGWRELSRRTYKVSTRQMADICRWNDPNGAWDYDDMRGEGLTVPDIRIICIEQVTAWADDLEA